MEKNVFHVLDVQVYGPAGGLSGGRGVERQSPTHEEEAEKNCAHLCSCRTAFPIQGAPSKRHREGLSSHAQESWAE